MNAFYYVAAYSSRTNAISRFLLTTPSANDAEQMALNALHAEWRVISAVVVCTTSDEVMMEI